MTEQALPLKVIVNNRTIIDTKGHCGTTAQLLTLKVIVNEEKLLILTHLNVK